VFSEDKRDGQISQRRKRITEYVGSAQVGHNHVGTLFGTIAGDPEATTMHPETHDNDFFAS